MEELLDAGDDHVHGHDVEAALGCLVFYPDGTDRAYRIDSPGPTPEEEAAIERRLAAVRPMILDALDAVMGEE